MSEPESRIRNISDTARWVAVYRARETERTDAVFRDPFARGLAGERGEQIAASMSFAEKNSWPFVARTWLIDQVISSQVKLGTDMVVNLAAGLDARPYRMNLPGALQWVEVDLPEILAYKEDVLRNETPVCQVERVRLDLSDVRVRGELFSQLGRRANRALVISEGLLVYLDEKEVTSLGQDLAVAPSFQHWVIDLASPALLKMLAKKMGAPLDQAGAPLKFAPLEFEAKVRKWSAELAKSRGVLASNVSFSVQRETKYLVNTDGTRLQHGRMNEIFQTGLHEFISGFIADNNRLGALITEQYLL